MSPATYVCYVRVPHAAATPDSSLAAMVRHRGGSRNKQTGQYTAAINLIASTLYVRAWLARVGCLVMACSCSLTGGLKMRLIVASGQSGGSKQRQQLTVEAVLLTCITQHTRNGEA